VRTEEFSLKAIYLVHIVERVTKLAYVRLYAPNPNKDTNIIDSNQPTFDISPS